MPGSATSRPFVSVFIQSYNHGKYVADAIQSVLDQTYDHFELIIVDDGSEDESPALIADFGRRFPERIRFFNRPNNLGLVATYNEGVSYARGDLLVAIGSDDMLHSDGLERRVAYSLAHPEVDFFGSDFDVMDRTGRVVTGTDKLAVVPQFSRYFKVDFADIYVELLKGNFLPDIAITVSFQRMARDDIRYDEQCPNLSDYDLWLRLSQKHRWGYLDDATCTYRWHGANLSHPRTAENTASRLIPQMIYILSKQLVEEKSTFRRRIIGRRISLLCLAFNLSEGSIGALVRKLQQVFRIGPDRSEGESRP